MGFELDKYFYSNAEMLSGVPMTCRMRLEEGIQSKKAKAGKVIYREGTLPKGLYILRKGKVKLYLTTQAGRKQIVYIYTVGEIFGYRPIICNEPHPISAVTLEDCVFDFIPREHFLMCLRNSFEMNQALLVSLCHEFVVWVNTISVFAQFPVRSRVALGLLVLREKYRLKGRFGDINLSRNDIASYVGSVKESVVRVLQEFKKKKIVETQGRKIRVLKPEELKAIVTFY